MTVEPFQRLNQALRNFGLKVGMGILHRRLLAIVQDDDVCRRLMTIPGRPCGRAGLSRYRRCAGPLPELQGGRSGVWTDTLQVSIRRE
jgi:hypothetical protein